ncbi:MAG: hypothetical protein ACHQQQ_11075 [Bacteroidota bacterium]
MAILECLECHKEISEEALKCPHCAAPKRMAIGKSDGAISIIRITGVFLIIVGIITIVITFDEISRGYHVGEVGGMGGMIIVIGAIMLFMKINLRKEPTIETKKDESSMICDNCKYEFPPNDQSIYCPKCGSKL